MSDIQRYTLHPDGTELDDEGDWMYYADHLAAVAAADATLKRAENAWREEIRTRLTEQYEAGVQAAREAVAAHIRADLTGQEMFCGRKRGILAAIDALISGKIGESDE